jgi:hypothetical protein
VAPNPPDARIAGKLKSEPVTNLRGAGVSVNVAVLVQALSALVFVSLVALTVVFLLAGINKNSQIDRLQQHGAPVEVVVTGCRGELGGTGTNAVGYSCRGSFVVDGHRYDESIPGNAFHAPGTHLAALAVPNDPALLDTVADVRGEHASGSVFILPAVLFVAALLDAAWVLRRLRHRRSGSVA